MLEELTGRNLNLSEVSLSGKRGQTGKLTFLDVEQKLEEFHATVEDLEALKELNDELEESHVETEKQMQEELGSFRLSFPRLCSRADPACPLRPLCFFLLPLSSFLPISRPSPRSRQQTLKTFNCATSTCAAMPSRRAWRITR